MDNFYDFAPEAVIPLEEFLGARTMRAFKCIEKVECLLLKKSPDNTKCRLIEDFIPLTLRRQLSEAQNIFLKEILLNPKSYWHGNPVYRRFPPVPGLGIEIFTQQLRVHLLVDLQNPGWTMHCESEDLWGFNFAGPKLAKLAKEIFPEYASPHKAAVWRKGAIKELELMAAKRG